MKLASFSADGRTSIGAVTGRELLDLILAWPSLMGSDVHPPPTTLIDLLSNPGVLPRLSANVSRASAALIQRHRIPLSSVSLHAPLARCGKLICVASNYTAHIEEAGQQAPLDKQAYTPWLFLKPVTSIIGHGAPIHIPRSGQAIDWEVELAAVIGQTGKHIPLDQALSYVAGYTIVNDVSERRFKAPPDRQAREWDKFFDWQHGKWFDGFAPMGPFLVTADEISDPQNLTLELRLNGRVRQHGSTASMIYSVAELVSFASSIMTLQPGDVIATGTPQGVGSAAGEFLRPGDEIECEVEALEILTNPVRAEDELAEVS
jgi:2-keto-4-pentenoate hydratase/2-oxohepta-3-ene-1,7-dioic acid hydratase in catechol pathway